MSSALFTGHVVRTARLGLMALATIAALTGAMSQPDAAEIGRALGETIYVPAYSRANTDEERSQPLASTAVVHNVDPSVEIALRSVRYYDHSGEMLKEFLSEPVILKPFESLSFLTPIADTAGGVGANYIVEWTATEPALSPLAESIMIGGTGTQGISFSARGRVIARINAGE